MPMYHINKDLDYALNPLSSDFEIDESHDEDDI